MHSLAALGLRRLGLGLLSCLVLLASAQPGHATDLSGTWQGHWEDCDRGHTGPLRATFCKCDDQHYRVVFSGRFWKVVPFRYAVTLNVVGKHGNKVLLAGESNVPFFGTFSYSAEASGCEFVANFTSCHYQGRFVLERCCRCPE